MNAGRRMRWNAAAALGPGPDKEDQDHDRHDPTHPEPDLSEQPVIPASQRIALAREYLSAALSRRVGELPPTVLLRECAELRRQLGAVLAAIDAGKLLDVGQAATVLAALDDASGSIRDRAAYCPACAAHPADLCDECAHRLAHAEAYDLLAATLRDSGQ